MHRWIRHGILLAGVMDVLAAPRAAAQQQPSAELARVRVLVRDVEGPVSEARVRAGRIGTVTNESGEAVLRLAPGARTIVAVKLGFRPDSLSLELRAASDTTVAITLVELPEALEAVVVTTTRSEHHIEQEPERVEVLAGEEIDEKTQMHPASLTTLLTELSGVRIQPTSSALGGVGVRIHGLRAQYTQLLSDGLPLYGSAPSGLGLLQIPPVDLQQVEVVKGASTALYGPGALGGVVNLVSRRPGDEHALVLNQTSRGGTDVLAWLSDSLDATWGYTMVAGAHRQRLVERGDENWAALPRFERGEIRPRLFWRGASGATVLTTIGAMRETRDGGAPASIASDAPFPISTSTTRADAGVLARVPDLGGGLLAVRAAASGRWQDHERNGTSYDDRLETLFAEVTWARASGAAEWLLGTAVERDAYRNDDLSSLHFAYTVPAVFAQLTLSPTAWLTTTATGRCDDHSAYGTICSPRLSGLFRLSDVWSLRASGGGGFFAPTLFTEATEDVDLTLLDPPHDLVAERARSGSVDLTARKDALELNATVFAANVRHPLSLEELPNGRVALRNASGTLRTRGVEVYGIYDQEPVAVIGYWSSLRASEPTLEGDRRVVPLDPRQTFGVDLAYEKLSVGRRVAVEVFHTGAQRLEHSATAATLAPGYTTYELLLTQRFGHVQLWINGENLTDVHQGTHGPLRLSSPGAGGRIAVDQWAPLEGRTFNAGVRVEL